MVIILGHNKSIIFYNNTFIKLWGGNAKLLLRQNTGRKGNFGHMISCKCMNEQV